MSISVILLLGLLVSLCVILGIILLFYKGYHSGRSESNDIFEMLKADYENYHLQKRQKRFEYGIREKSNFGCMICLEEYQIEAQVITLPCNSNHTFHSECLK